MPFKKIKDNVYLGDQFSNNINTDFQLKVSNIYYDILLNQKDDKIVYFRKDAFVKTTTKLALNLFDSYDVSDFNPVIFAVAVKFIAENSPEHQVYIHCQLGISRSPSIIFVYLVVSGKIQCNFFIEALNEYLRDFCPFMKVNYGVYQFLKNNFPFNNIKKLVKRRWEELECIT